MSGMAERAQAVQEKSAARAMALLQAVLRDCRPRNFAVELWDGNRLDPEPGQFCRFTWRVNHPNVLRSVLRSDRQVALGESYIFGDFDITGDILAVFPIAEYLADKHFSAAEKLRIAGLALGLSSKVGENSGSLHGRLHSRARDRQAVSFHYDVSNDFYRLWLDREMVYSCAYFKSDDDSIEIAQHQKLDYICRKLRLRPGERLLDIGCGWGGLIQFAAQNYGVRSVGITLSRQQVTLAQQHIAEAGLDSCCEAHLLDYRDAASLGDFDKIVSVGMVEHVGEAKLPEYFRCAFELLKPGGVFLNHGIGRAGNRAKPAEPTFTDVYVFPDGELVPLSTTLEYAERAGFEVHDVENLREHYFLTLCHWLRRLEANAREARRLVGEVKYRIWHLYLAGSAHYFQSGKLDVYQSLLWKRAGHRGRLPLTRQDWYLDS